MALLLHNPCEIWMGHGHPLAAELEHGVMSMQLLTAWQPQEVKLPCRGGQLPVLFALCCHFSGQLLPGYGAVLHGGIQVTSRFAAGWHADASLPAHRLKWPLLIQMVPKYRDYTTVLREAICTDGRYLLSRGGAGKPWKEKRWTRT